MSRATDVHELDPLRDPALNLRLKGCLGKDRSDHDDVRFGCDRRGERPLYIRQAPWQRQRGSLRTASRGRPSTGFIAPGAHDGMLQFTWIACVDVFGALGSGLTVNGGFAANFLTCAWASAIPPPDDVPDPELLPAELLDCHWMTFQTPSYSQRNHYSRNPQ